MNRRKDRDNDRLADDMAHRAQNLEGMFGNGPEPDAEPASASATTTILEHISRLVSEWSQADPRKSEKRQALYGTWAQIWNAQGRGHFAINLNTGSIWPLKRSPRSKPIGNVRTMTGQQIVELLKE